MTHHQNHAASNIELAESLTMAFLVLLESLSPVERAAFLLHEVFDYDYKETAEIIGKTDANCWQMIHRALKSISRHGIVVLIRLAKRPKGSRTDSSKPPKTATFRGS